MAAQGQQMLAIPRDDQIGTRCDSGGNDLIVIDIIDITDHHTRHADGSGPGLAGEALNGFSGGDDGNGVEILERERSLGQRGSH